MFEKRWLVLLLVFLISPCALAQSGFDPAVADESVAEVPLKKNVPDFGSPFVETPATPRAFEELPPAPKMSVEDTVKALSDAYDQVIQRRNAELAGRLAKQIAAQKPVVPNASWTDPENAQILDRVKALEAWKEQAEKKFVTEERSREIAQEEIKKVLVTLKLADGTVKDVPLELDTREVTVPGYSGTFTLKAGESIVAIDGEPVQRRPQTEYYNGAAGMYRLQAAPVDAGYRVRVQSPPRPRLLRSSSQCQVINGVRVCPQ